MVYGVERTIKVEKHQGANMTFVNTGKKVVVDFGQGGLGRVESAVGRLDWRKETVDVSMLRQSGIYDTFKKL